MSKKTLFFCFFIFCRLSLGYAQEVVKRDEVINQIFNLIQNSTKVITQKETQSQTQNQNLPNISPSIIKKSDEFLISKLGEEFFIKYVILDRRSTQFNLADQFCIKNPSGCSSYLQKPYYLMVYTLRMRGKSFVNVSLEFALDEDGKLIIERDVVGVPNCVADSGECVFAIDESQAQEIAKKAAFSNDSSNWKTDFTWHGGNLNTYVWTVSNNFGKSMGQTVIIDANTGEVLDINDWEKNS